MMRLLLASALLISLAGCAWIGRQADALGEHMPVIGERCEHWQCITASGRARSDMYKAQRAEQRNAGSQNVPQQQMQYQQYQPYQQQQQMQYRQQQHMQMQYQQQRQTPLTPYDYYNQ